jgi:hypothetical protein
MSREIDEVFILIYTLKLKRRRLRERDKMRSIPLQPSLRHEPAPRMIHQIAPNRYVQ